MHRVLTYAYHATEEEVDDPPDVPYTSFHKDVFRTMALKEEYIANNPQVWQTSTSEPGAERPKMQLWPPWENTSEENFGVLSGT